MPSVDEIIKSCEYVFSNSITEEGFKKHRISSFKRRVSKGLENQEFFGLYATKNEMGITLKRPLNENLTYIPYAVKK